MVQCLTFIIASNGPDNPRGLEKECNVLEVCVDSIDGVIAAKNGGAGRVELCSSLSEGGLTPSAGLMRAAAALPVPCYAMIRPRSGLFEFSEAEVKIMLADIAMVQEAGLGWAGRRGAGCPKCRWWIEYADALAADCRGG